MSNLCHAFVISGLFLGYFYYKLPYLCQFIFLHIHTIIVNILLCRVLALFYHKQLQNLFLCTFYDTFDLVSYSKNFYKRKSDKTYFEYICLTTFFYIIYTDQILSNVFIYCFLLFQLLYRLIFRFTSTSKLFQPYLASYPYHKLYHEVLLHF